MAFCKISFDLFCDKGTDPVYRLYVNNELMTERAFTFTGNQYLREILQIDAPPGEYKIHLEKVTPGRFRIRNHSVDYGPAEIVDSTTFKVLE